MAKTLWGLRFLYQDTLSIKRFFYLCWKSFEFLVWMLYIVPFIINWKIKRHDGRKVISYKTKENTWYIIMNVNAVSSRIYFSNTLSYEEDLQFRLKFIRYITLPCLSGFHMSVRLTDYVPFCPWRCFSCNLHLQLWPTLVTQSFTLPLWGLWRRIRWRKQCGLP